MIDELHEKILCFLEADTNEDLPNMINFSKEIHRCVKNVFKAAKKGERFEVSHIIDLLESISNYTPVFKHTSIGHVEEYGLQVCLNDIIMLKSMRANRTYEDRDRPPG